MSSELEATVDYLRSSFVRHRMTIFWICFALLLGVLVVAVREVAVLLLASYGIAILLDPLVSRVERRGVPRSAAICGLGALLLLILIGLLVLAVPILIREYQQFITFLPDYLEKSLARISGFLEEWFGVAPPTDIDELALQLRDSLGALGVEKVQAFALATGRTMLRGYSLVLTLINLFLLPFFVFYMTRDLRQIHRFLASFLPKESRWKVRTIGLEILVHVYAFFRGQLIVCVMLALLYVIGLSLVGLPSAIIVGTLAGLLNFVPFLGVGLGLILSTIITLVSEPTLTQFALVYGVFGVVQLLEGSVITPKIVGESMGIHPLGVMLALIVGGQLFGLLGLILAIPVAASVRVLFRHLRAALEGMDEDEEAPVKPKLPVTEKAADLSTPPAAG